MVGPLPGKHRITILPVIVPLDTFRRSGNLLDLAIISDNVDALHCQAIDRAIRYDTAVADRESAFDPIAFAAAGESTILYFASIPTSQSNTLRTCSFLIVRQR